MTAVEDQVKAVIAEVLQCSPLDVTKDMTMKETEAWDSLKHMELIAVIESTFSLRLSFDEIVNMVSVTGIQKIVAAKLSGE